MKYVSLLIAVFLLLSFGGCALANDTPRHTADEVTTIAKSFSSQCQVQTGETCGWGGKKTPQYEEAEPVYTAEYLGNGMWSISKACSINSEYDRGGYFYDSTNELVWKWTSYQMDWKRADVPMSDILDEAQALVQCKACPWYKSCVLPMRLTEDDLRKQLESSIPGAATPGAEQYGMQQLLSGLAAAAENSLLEGCPVFINRLRSNPKLAEQIKKLMREWTRESEGQTS